MKYILLVILPVLLFSGCQKTAAPPELRDVNVDEALALMSSKSSLTVLDIRTPDEYGAGHIKDAKLINFKDPNFATEIAKLDRNKPYLMHCASGGRSGQAMATFRELGFTELYHLKDGFNGWKSSGQSIATD